MIGNTHTQSSLCLAHYSFSVTAEHTRIAKTNCPLLQALDTCPFFSMVVLVIVVDHKI